MKLEMWGWASKEMLKSYKRIKKCNVTQNQSIGDALVTRFKSKNDYRVRVTVETINNI